MKTTLTLSLLSIFLITTQAYSQSIGINGDGTTPDANTMLDIKSTGSTSATYGLKVKDATGTANMVVRDDGNVGDWDSLSRN